MQSRAGGGSQAQGLTGRGRGGWGGERIGLPSREGVGATARQGPGPEPLLVWREKYLLPPPSWDLPSQQAGGVTGQDPLLSVQPTGKLRWGQVPDKVGPGGALTSQPCSLVRSCVCLEGAPHSGSGTWPPFLSSEFSALFC